MIKTSKIQKKKTFGKTLGILVFCLVSVFIGTGCQKKAVDNTELTSVTLNGKQVTLKPGDVLSADAWNEGEVIFNGKEKSKKKYPKMYKNITIGSKLSEVIDAFALKPGYAVIDREIDTCGDGTTDIVREEYKDTEFFDKEKVLDGNFIFGYQKKDGQWKALTYEALEELDEQESDVLLYQIDICGLKGEQVEEKSVISFSVTYQ